MSAVATVVIWELISRAFGMFLSIAASTQISSLYGKKLFDDAQQVVCDLYRLCFVSGCIVPAILIPVTKPYARWCLATEETSEMALKYIIPQAAGNVFTCIFYTNVGILQAEGRTLLVGIIDVIALGVGMGVLNPLFMGKLKMGIIGPSISTVIADAVPGIILTILFFCGKFGTKPKLSGLIKPFSKHTYQAIVVGSSQFISQLSNAVPAIFMRRVMGKSLIDKSKYDVMMSGMNVAYRYTSLITAINLALCAGFLAPGAYAYAAQKYKRYIALTIHLNWIGFVWCIISEIIVIALAKPLSKLFGNGEAFLDWAVKELKAANWATFVMFIKYTLISMLQSQQRGKRAMIVSLSSNFLAFLASIYIIDAVHPHQPEKIMWCFWITSVVGLVLGSILIFKPFYQIIKKSKEEKTEDENELSSKADTESPDIENQNSENQGAENKNSEEQEAAKKTSENKNSDNQNLDNEDTEPNNDVESQNS
ncbi:hypothetical protein TVAG_476630 [Trichomonas vaginalis G3]|uniref:MatE family protein n=1 Tax=Trichomonas vaginalis (strain ATCC PRA-98 / G3) TaxID=412133 RepID=A2DA86_TRIV3|nr:multidrug resistance protein YPNP-related family [Trichomonas vaginalis G3]EAY22734.1 hypothetical protein TVAG_476630 [Trichomonas vaginalis G3]KAI5525545.1 multidrug resistance protein YPNP-related family [Trichomonas vaginalis G3]|eukprot:XP_001583720.1 hypothetical protein [Trichomonas vaginalis G3]